MEKHLNFNVGILGHVDSGKTSLAKALSTIASTAAFDKNPQSQERGITIDLGFSSFVTDAPNHILECGFSKLQFTLVDCPGHASLIRTIIGGAQIIDAMILVIDITKGIQTQTAECLVIGNIMCKEMIIVLNKIDLIPPEKQKQAIEKCSKKILITIKNTKFSNAKVISVSANPSMSSENEKTSNPIGIEELIRCLKSMSYVPIRSENEPFVFAVDHCFGIKGQGTVITGTILQGVVAVNNLIEIPTLKVTKKIKSIQMFRQPVEKAIQGDRIGLCVTQFDPKLLERSIIGTPDYIQCAKGFICLVYKIGYYKSSICSKTKFHISMGHDTILSKVTFFGSDDEIYLDQKLNLDLEYLYQEELIDVKKIGLTDLHMPKHQLALVEFEKVVPVRQNSTFIASKLDMDVHTNMCRLAFWGKVVHPLLDNYKRDIFPKLKVFKDKFREGIIERMNNESELIVKNLLKKGTDISIYKGLEVILSTGEKAIVEGNFGQSGKIKIAVNNLKPETRQKLKALSDNRKKVKKNSESENKPVVNTPVAVSLKFKKYIFNPNKKIVQTK